MNLTKVTRNTSSTSIEPQSGTTEFQIHCNNVRSFKNLNTIDFSERKIRHLLKLNYTFHLNEMLEKYVSGNVAVAWRQGKALFIYIVKD